MPIRAASPGRPFRASFVRWYVPAIAAIGTAWLLVEGAACLWKVTTCYWILAAKRFTTHCPERMRHLLRLCVPYCLRWVDQP